MGTIWETVHESFAKSRRVRVLSGHYADLLPAGSTILDVGTGDGEIARLVMNERTDLAIEGVEYLVRPDCAIPVTAFNGRELPFADNAWDFVSMVDVLHHTEDPNILLREAGRVARRGILIKDHLVQGFGARATLRFMDGVGNRRFGVALPYVYWTPQQWRAAVEDMEMVIGEWREDLGIYPWPASLLFGRGLHVFMRLEHVEKGRKNG